MNRLLATAFLAAALCAVACGPPKLDRPRAARLVEADGAFTALSTTLEPTPTALEVGVALDLWNPDWKLTPKGGTLFSGANSSGLVPLKPIPVDLDVTGIASPMIGDTESTRVISMAFSSHPDLPIKLLAATTGTGEAIARRYDDGWRLEALNLTWRSAEPGVNGAVLGIKVENVYAALSPEEIDRLRAEVNSIRTTRQARLGKLDERLKRSTVATTRETVLTGPVKWAGHVADSIILTDVSLIAMGTEFPWAGGDGKHDYEYPFQYFRDYSAYQPSAEEVNLNWKCEEGDPPLERSIPFQLCSTLVPFGSEADAEAFKEKFLARVAQWRAKYVAMKDERAMLARSLQFVYE